MTDQAPEKLLAQLRKLEKDVERLIADGEARNLLYYTENQPVDLEVEHLVLAYVRSARKLWELGDEKIAAQLIERIKLRVEELGYDGETARAFKNLETQPTESE